MIAILKKMVHDCLTENNGSSFCPFRVAGAALAGSGIPTFIGCTIFTTIHTEHFDAVQFGIGFGGLMGGLTALAAGVAFKARTDTP
jgi:hypothetical protein